MYIWINYTVWHSHIHDMQDNYKGFAFKSLTLLECFKQYKLEMYASPSFSCTYLAYKSLKALLENVYLKPQLIFVLMWSELCNDFRSIKIISTYILWFFRGNDGFCVINVCFNYLGLHLACSDIARGGASRLAKVIWKKDWLFLWLLITLRQPPELIYGWMQLTHRIFKGKAFHLVCKQWKLVDIGHFIRFWILSESCQTWPINAGKWLLV